MWSQPMHPKEKIFKPIRMNMLLEVIKTQFILELENNNYTAQKMSNK